MRISLFIGALALVLAATANAASSGGVHMFVRHDVADYAKWRGSYDKFRATQRQMGVTAQAVYQSVDNPNDITVTHDFKSEAAAKAFVAV